MVGTLGVLAGAGLALTFLPPLHVPAPTGGRGHEAVGPRIAQAGNPYRWFPPAGLVRRGRERRLGQGQVQGGA